MDQLDNLLLHEENELSEITKTFDFHDFFQTSEEMLNKMRTKSFITNSIYRVCPRPSHRSKTMTQSTSTKTGSCFICGLEFPHAELSTHEKSCLENIQADDIKYTRQNTDDSGSSLTQMIDTSNISNHSGASSNDSYEKKYVRCYICGTDVPTYLTSIHEKNCKKSWETGLLSSICTPARTTASRGDIASASLSRGTSRTDLRKDLQNGGLVKSKSSTNLRSTPKDDVFTRSKTTPRKSSDSSKTRSTSNLSRSNTPDTKPNKDRKPSWNQNQAKSLQDIRKENTPSRKIEKKKPDTLPQYVECHYCGKQYSMHSIGIHQKQCQRTRHLQKNAGTEVEYKKKSKSLVDLFGISKSRSSASLTRPSTASSIKRTDNAKTPPSRPSTANPLSRVARNSGLSASMGNLQMKHNSKDHQADDKTPVKVFSDVIKTEKTVSSSPGPQKCYLCGQLYGTRSLPIHEKQCLKKWEREQKEETERSRDKKKPRREIKLVPFGRSKLQETNQNSPLSTNQIMTPSKLFGVESPLKSSGLTDKPSEENSTTSITSSEQNEESAKDSSQVNGGTSLNNNSQDFKRNLISRSISTKKDTETNINSTESSSPLSSSSRPASANKFVLCVYCGRQYGLHSIHIHEKSCRDRNEIENDAKDRIIKNGTHVNGIHSETNGDSFCLVTCDDCSRKFLSTDIEKHRGHCRVAVL